jgi:hypothetical protein
MLSGKQEAGMGNKQRYRIDLVRDNPEALRDALEMIGEEGRKLVQVVWTPDRNADYGESSAPVKAKFVVISESDNAHRS